MRRTILGAFLAVLAAALPGPVGAQGEAVPGRAVEQPLSAADEREAVMKVIRELVDTYERRRITAFMRLWDDDRFRGFVQLERDVESDFETLWDIRLLYTNARVTLAPRGRALFEADWEKRYMVRGDTADQKQTGRMILLLEKEKGRWLIAGMSGERIFGATGGLPDVAVASIDVAGGSSATVLTSNTLRATIKNLRQTRASNVAVRFYEGKTQIGSDQRVSFAGIQTATAQVTWTPQLPLGTRTIKVVADPDERVSDVNRSNNTLTKAIEVRATDAVLTVTPSTVTFPGSLEGNASVTIRVVDLDRDNENRVNVVLRATYPNDMGGPCTLGTETETFELTKVSTGTFQRTSIPTCKSTDCIPSSNNGLFEFRTSGGCAASITVTVVYVEPLASNGQTNVERTAAFTAN